jgi:hypothetical protein
MAQGLSIAYQPIYLARGVSVNPVLPKGIGAQIHDSDAKIGTSKQETSCRLDELHCWPYEYLTRKCNKLRILLCLKMLDCSSSDLSTSKTYKIARPVSLGRRACGSTRVSSVIEKWWRNFRSCYKWMASAFQDIRNSHNLGIRGENI